MFSDCVAHRRRKEDVDDQPDSDGSTSSSKPGKTTGKEDMKTGHIKDVSLADELPPKKIQVSQVIGSIGWTAFCYFLVLAYKLYTGPCTRERGAQGGWWPPSNDDFNFLNSSKCTIKRMSADDLTAEIFNRDLHLKEPVLITFPKGSSDWTNPDLWTFENISRSYASFHEVGWGTSNGIVRRGGSGEVKTSLREYVDRVMHGPSAAKEPGYVFDRSFVDEASGLLASFHLPGYLQINAEVDDTFFFLGGSRSGVMFHKHADGWNGVVFGRKRWFLYPGNHTPPGGIFSAYSMLQWYLTVYPNLRDEDKPIECIQEAGEILYIPESYYHGTFNIGDTIAVGSQKREALTEVEQLFYAGRGRKEALQEAKTEEEHLNLKQETVIRYKKILEIWPGHTESMVRLAEELIALDDRETAMRLLKQVLDKDEYFVLAMLSLAKLFMEDAGKLPLAEHLLRRALRLVPNFADTYIQFAEVVLSTDRIEEMVSLMHQAYHYLDQNSYFWKHLDKLLKSYGYDNDRYIFILLHLLREAHSPWK